MEMLSEQKLQFHPTSDTSIKVSKHFGNTIPISINENGQPKYLLGPHFYIFFIAWIGSLCGFIYIVHLLYPYVHPAMTILNSCSAFMFLYFYGKIGFSLPGIASSENEPDFETKIKTKYCVPCKILKQKGTKHCLYCDVCIYELDHHCPWVGKCIGRDNIVLFYKFLLSFGCSMIIFVVSVFFANKGKH